MMLIVALCAAALQPAPSARLRAAQATADDIADVYRLGPGDKLRITIYNEPALTGEYTVTTAGAIAFPLIGNVGARGTSLASLQEALRRKLADGYVKDPRISVEMLNYRPYYILGEVTKPGEYPYSFNLKIVQAIAAAGGYTYRSNKRKVFLTRADDSRERKIDLRAQSITVLPGDTIRVGERYF